jgi:hypothetical protein
VVGEEATNLKGAGDLFGDTPLSTHFEALKVRTASSLEVQGQERRVAGESRRRPAQTGLEAVDEVNCSIPAQEDLTWFEGLSVLRAALPTLRRREACGSSDPDGWRARGVGGEGFGGEEPASHDQQRRFTPKQLERSHEGRKASKRVKLAERGESAARSPGDPGSRLRPVERESIARGGTRQLRQRAGVGETSGERPRTVRLRTRVDNRKGASDPERGARSSERGKLAARIPGMVVARNKVTTLELARKPLRG